MFTYAGSLGVHRTGRVCVGADLSMRGAKPLARVRLHLDRAGASHLVAGRADAVLVENGRVSVVFDWKSDVAPSPQDRMNYAGQLSDYLSATGAARGALVYMSLEEIVWISAPATAQP